MSIYEDVLTLNSDIGIVKEWCGDVKAFFKEYNSVDNIDSKAKMLIDRYNEFSKDKNYFGNIFGTENLLEYFVILITCLVGMIIVKEFLRCFK